MLYNTITICFNRPSYCHTVKNLQKTNNNHNSRVIYLTLFELNRLILIIGYLLHNKGSNYDAKKM